MNEKTENQLKFTKKFKEQIGVELDWDYYYITRGRGWSRSDGSSGALILSSEKDERIEYAFDGPITRYLPKKYHFCLLNKSVGIELFRAWYDENGKEVVE